MMTLPARAHSPKEGAPALTMSHKRASQETDPAVESQPCSQQISDSSKIPLAIIERIKTGEFGGAVVQSLKESAKYCQQIADDDYLTKDIDDLRCLGERFRICSNSIKLPSKLKAWLSPPDATIQEALKTGLPDMPWTPKKIAASCLLHNYPKEVAQRLAHWCAENVISPMYPDASFSFIPNHSVIELLTEQNTKVSNSICLKIQIKFNPMISQEGKDKVLFTDSSLVLYCILGIFFRPDNSPSSLEYISECTILLTEKTDSETPVQTSYSTRNKVIRADRQDPDDQSLFPL